MERRMTDTKDEIEIDLARIFAAVWKKAWIIAVAAVVSAVMAYVLTLLLITPQYKASAMFYVNNNTSSGSGVSSGDLTTSRNLVDSYIAILNTRESLNAIIDKSGADCTYAQLKEMITASAVDDTEIFQVTVTHPDPQQAQELAEAIVQVLPQRISSIIEGTSTKVVETAMVSASPSSPNYTKNTIVGFLLGVVAAVMVIVLREVFDTTIRTEEDIDRTCKYPVLASIPNMNLPERGGYGYGAERRSHPVQTGTKEAAVVGSSISFAASEAYKLLRTKLQFAFADDEQNSRIIAISSVYSGEGKSLSTVNLAYMLAQLNKKVIVLDCDMRRPTLAEKLGVEKYPGLSGYLTGQNELVSLVQQCSLGEDSAHFHVISAGQNPPNPVELLSSQKMQSALRALRKVYDYVILDTPPIGEVSDALAIAKETDGILLVVRQNNCDRVHLADAVRQFEFVNGKILGVLFNGTAEQGGKYRQYYKRTELRQDK